MKITVLLENLVYHSHLKSEHGLSLLIEDDDGKKILFDSGQSEIFAQNAEILGIDLSKVDSFVLSHGHYDHAGGLPKFLELNSKAPLYIGTNACLPKYHRGSYVGVPCLDELGPRWITASQPLALSSTVTLFPHIFIRDYGDTHFSDLEVEKCQSLVTDDFEDEQFLAIFKDRKLWLISGCSHRGMSNILATAFNFYSDVQQVILFGGLHLAESSDGQIDHFIQSLSRFPVTKIVTCHCTGIDQYHKLKDKMAIEVVYGKTGDTLTF